MARTVAALPAGSRITDSISLGVIAKCFPAKRVHAVLASTEKASIRQRDLPAHVVVYYMIALALYMEASNREVLRCLLEGVQWLLGSSVAVKVAGKSAISQARSRLGAVAASARRVGPPHRRPFDQGRLVCGSAVGELGRQHARRRRRAGQ